MANKPVVKRVTIERDMVEWTCDCGCQRTTLTRKDDDLPSIDIPPRLWIEVYGPLEQGDEPLCHVFATWQCVAAFASQKGKTEPAADCEEE